MAAAARPLVLVHGYSASGSSFDVWKRRLVETGRSRRSIHVCSYRSLTNEITLDDVAQGFDRALRIQTGLDRDEPFDAIVHSTGMLVVRAWLAADPRRGRRLRHLVGLAPASFGSPLAHKGRGWLGAIFRGNREIGPDFLEAGDRILDGLELGSRFTWDLALADMVARGPTFNAGIGTPYVFVFCGTRKYGGPLALVSDDGTDGTVRLAGAALNTRMIRLNLTLPQDESLDHRRVVTARPNHGDSPVIFVRGRDHGSILRDPPADLVRRVAEALGVETMDAYRAYQARARKDAAAAREAEEHGRWQQLIVRVVDERGHPVPDYFLDFLVKKRGHRKWTRWRNDRVHVHPYRNDRSLRCFHVDLTGFAPGSYDPDHDLLGLRLVADSGTPWVGYRGHSDGHVRLYAGEDDVPVQGRWTGVIDLSNLPKIDFFHPWTTTLLEIRLDREPQPLQGRNEVLWFPETAEGRQAAAAEAMRSGRLTASQAERLDHLYRELLEDDDEDRSG